MELIWPLLCGFGVAVLATMPPGLLNMSAVKTYHTSTPRSAYWFVLGASTVVAGEAALAVHFARFLERNPRIIFYLREAAVVLFALLGIYFLFFAKKPKQAKDNQSSKHANWHFFSGALLAALNFLVIPFYMVVGVYLASTAWFSIQPSSVFSLAAGVALGTSATLLGYTQLFKNNSESDSIVLKQMNRIIGGVLLLVACITLVQLLKS